MQKLGLVWQVYRYKLSSHDSAEESAAEAARESARRIPVPADPQTDLVSA